MRRRPCSQIIGCLLFICLGGLVARTADVSSPPVKPVPLKEYLEYARKSADYYWDNYDAVITRWREGFDADYVFGYRPPGGLLEMSVIYATLYEKEGIKEYADRAKQVLLTYGNFREMYPEYAIRRRVDYAEGIPVLPDFFTVMRYIRAYDILNGMDVFSPEEKKDIEDTIAFSMRYLLRTQEWGPMNRTALRAESLAWAVRAVDNHPDKPTWEMLRKSLGDDNWGNWEIEDATIYHGVWLYALCGYSYALDQMEALFKTPEMYYYAHYFLNLMSPDGMIPDFGDAHWQANWQHYLVYFETAAALYRDPHLKWAASVIARKFVDFDNPISTGLGYILLDCSLWGDDAVSPAEPESGSMEVMEDVQGKKIVFRSGWKTDSTYMLLNYRDEGDGGLNFRDYLRDTIPVEEEKMTHGHADENSIALLMAGGSVLLHDGGYRDHMPSGPFGAFRQDYFHNRLCVRPDKIFFGQKEGEYRYSVRDAVPGQNLLDFLYNAGSYRIIRTQKVDFLSFDDFDYSRTRLIDDKMGYLWDRVITYIKDPGIFVVFDIFKATKEDYFTLANLWHTRTIKARGEHWYDTVYDRIRNQELKTDTHLLIHFPQTHFKEEGVLPEKRHYQDEWLIHQTTAQHFELGETQGFITVLIPHPADESPEKQIGRIHLLPVGPDGKGMGVRIENGDGEILVGVKNDLRMDMIRDWRRPRYTFDAGRMDYGDFTTNGDFLFAEVNAAGGRYTCVNMTKILYRDTVLHAAKEALFGLAFDASPDTGGIGKLRYWRDTFSLKKGSAK
ncbi:MAG: hypothetical protein KJ768_11595 [Acidobacteria bacterium]|nr:hypothetical protein [Acidobacteriota bacterium]